MWTLFNWMRIFLLQNESHYQHSGCQLHISYVCLERSSVDTLNTLLLAVRFEVAKCFAISTITSTTTLICPHNGSCKIADIYSARPARDALLLIDAALIATALSIPRAFLRYSGLNFTLHDHSFWLHAIHSLPLTSIFGLFP